MSATWTVAEVRTMFFVYLVGICLGLTYLIAVGLRHG
jgi:hypothetical protein